jgi:hypothetical protein
VLLFLISAIHIPAPAFIRNFVAALKSPFLPFLSVSEAEAFLHAEGEVVAYETCRKPPFWKTLTLTFVGSLETTTWLAIGSYRLAESHEGGTSELWAIWTPFVVATTWAYASIRPAARPKSTPSYDLFALYIVHFIAASTVISRIVYDKSTMNAPYPPPIVLGPACLNFLAPLLLILVVLTMPVGTPSQHVDATEIVSTLGYT